jgi:hypothetical protein
VNLRTQWVIALGLPKAVCPLSARDRHVGRVLAEHMYSDGSSCYPGVGLLAEETSLAASTVWLAIDSLEAKGSLHVTRARGRSRSHTYTPIVPNTSGNRKFSRTNFGGGGRRENLRLTPRKHPVQPRKTSGNRRRGL